MKIKMYQLISRAIEEGVDFGWNRAHKHSEKPEKNTVLDSIHSEVMSQICEVFDFDDEFAND